MHRALSRRCTATRRPPLRPTVKNGGTCPCKVTTIRPPYAPRAAAASRAAAPVLQLRLTRFTGKTASYKSPLRLFIVRRDFLRRCKSCKTRGETSDGPRPVPSVTDRMGPDSGYRGRQSLGLSGGVALAAQTLTLVAASSSSASR